MRSLWGTIVNDYCSLGACSLIPFYVYRLETFERRLSQVPYLRRKGLWRIAPGLRRSFDCSRHSSKLGRELWGMRGQLMILEDFMHLISGGAAVVADFTPLEAISQWLSASSKSEDSAKLRTPCQPSARLFCCIMKRNPMYQSQVIRAPFRYQLHDGSFSPSVATTLSIMVV